jgi:hypothetical protein
MTITNPSYPLVSFGLDDTNIKDKGIASDGGADTPAFAFCTINDLITGIQTVAPYATFEPNYWALDGSYHFMPTSPHIGWLGSILSNSSGVAFGDATIVIDFTALQSVTSLTLHFDKPSNNWCSTIEVSFLDSGFSSIYTTTVNPTSIDYTLTHTVSNFNHIYIYLRVTNNPYRFPRLTGIDFNEVTHLDGAKISDAKITEEFSPISETLTANSLELDLRLDSSDFSITNPASPYANLVDRMPFMVYEVVDNVTNFMGQFYLNTWENPSPSSQVVKFNCIDAIGLMAKIPFYGWIRTGSGVNSLSSILSYMFTACNLKYSIDASIPSYYVVGELEPSSMRDALQKLAFACRLSVKTVGSYKVIVDTTMATNLPAYLISGDQQYTVSLSQEQIKKVSLLPVYDEMKCTQNQYADSGAGLSTIYSQSLAIGKYVIPFPQPQGALILSGAAWVTPAGWNDGGAWNAVINVTSPGTVTITSSGNMIESSNAGIYGNSTNPQKVAEVDCGANLTSGLISGTMGLVGMATWMNDYYSSRYYQKSTVFSLICHAGDIVLIDSTDTKHILGIIESASIDLVGLRTEIEVVGTLL